MAEKEYIEREKAFDAVFGQFCASSDETEAALNAAIEEIRAIPAADVRHVVRGKWIADGDGYHWTYNFSICGWKDGYPFNERHNYCPHCGANMREES